MTQQLNLCLTFCCLRCSTVHRSCTRCAIPHEILGKPLERIGWHPIYNIVVIGSLQQYYSLPTLSQLALFSVFKCDFHIFYQVICYFPFPLIRFLPIFMCYRFRLFSSNFRMVSSMSIFYLLFLFLFSSSNFNFRLCFLAHALYQVFNCSVVFSVFWPNWTVYHNTFYHTVLCPVVLYHIFLYHYRNRFASGRWGTRTRRRWRDSKITRLCLFARCPTALVYLCTPPWWVCLPRVSPPPPRSSGGECFK